MDCAPNAQYSRKDIASWLKLLPYSQNLNDGVLFCRVLQKSYPAYFLRMIELPRSDFECLSNFKMLGRCLDKNGLYGITDLDRFANSKDFFEFACWLKNFVEKNQSHSTGSAIQLLQQNRAELGHARSPILNRVKTATSVCNSAKKEEIDPLTASNKDLRNFLGDSDNYLRRDDSQKKNGDGGQKDWLKGSQVLAALKAPSHLPPSMPKKSPEVAASAQQPVDLYEAYQGDTKALLMLYAYETDVEYLKSTLQQLRQAIETGHSVYDIKNEICSRLFDKSLK